MGLFFLYQLDDISAAANWILEQTAGCKIILLEGEMGSGKTTICKALAQLLGANSELSSPTYSLVNEYPSLQHGSIFHLDLYRLKDTEEAISIGVEDNLLSGHYCLIEWPEIIFPLLREIAYVQIKIESKSNEKRKLVLINSEKQFTQITD